MSKKNARGAKIREEATLDSGVTVTVLPFPAGLFEKVQARALADFPDPVPPKKEIPVVDGVEEVADTNDPEYQERKKLAEGQRWLCLVEAVVENCIELDLGACQPAIDRLAKHEQLPEDPRERLSRFISSHALRTARDYERVTLSAVLQTVIHDSEVADRLSLLDVRWRGQPLVTLAHPALMQSSGWTYTSRARNLRAARWWGCPSPGFFRLSGQGRATRHRRALRNGLARQGC